MARSIIIWVFLLLAIAALDASGLLTQFDNAILERRFETISRPPSGDILVVDIDAQSLAEVGVWPWPRHKHAELIDKLTEAGAQDIALDIDFSAATSPEEDAALARALDRAGNSVLLAVFQQFANARSNAGDVLVNRPLPMFAEHGWPANVNVLAEHDGRVWRGSFGRVIAGESIPSMSAFLSGRTTVLGPDFLIDFGIDADAIERVSYIDIIEGRVPDRRLMGKKIIVGASAVELRDLFAVPVFGILPGAVLQALAAESIAQDRALTSTGPLPQHGLLVAVAALLLFLRKRSWRLKLLLIASLAIGGETLALIVLQSYPLVVNTGVWLAGLTIFGIAVVVGEAGLRQILLLVSRIQAKNSQTILDRVISDNFNGIVVVDHNGKIVAASNAAKTFLGLSLAANLDSAALGDVLPAPLASAVRRAISETAPIHPLQEVDIEIKGRGQRTLEFIVTPSLLSEVTNEEKGSSKDVRVACLTFSDITVRRAQEARLAYLASYDPVSGAANRNAFLQFTAECLQEQHETHASISVLALDLHRFDAVGATIGHHCCDLLLAAVTERISRFCKGKSIVANLGGSHFAVLVSSPSDAELQADPGFDIEGLIRTLGETFNLEGNHVVIGVNIGVTDSADADKRADILLRQAETALSQAKKSGVNTWTRFEAGMDLRLMRRRIMELDLRRAIARQELHVAYQPQISLQTSKTVGVEALLRWNHPDHGIIAPTEFIAVAEDCGLIEQLGRWVIEQACTEAASFAEPIRLAVNVSAMQFQKSGLVKTVRDALSASGFPPSRLDLEITESLFMQDCKRTQAIMNEFRDMGVGFALDDFGSGYASIGYLTRFPLQKIKLDKSFIDTIAQDEKTYAIVRAIAGLATDLGLDVVAEGIETPAQLEAVKAAGCGIGQGYLLGRPESVDRLAVRLSGSGFSRQIS